jgi:glutamate-1-semialdehyde aminotransferase
VFLAPSQFEAAFVSAAHTSRNVTHTIASARDSFKAMGAAPAS